MTIEVKLPSLGEGVESGDIVELKVSEGDMVAKNQGILELETDKATVEVPCAHAGRVVKIHVQNGQTVRVGAVLLSLEGSSAPAPSQSPAASPPAAVVAPTSSVGSPPSNATPASSAAVPPGNLATAAPISVSPPPLVPPDRPVVASASIHIATGSTAAAAAADSLASGSDIHAAGPAVRRFAREAGVDLSRIKGTGEGGRITREDVLDAVRRGSATTAAPVATTAPPPTPRTGPPEPAPTKHSVAEDQSSDAWGPIRVQPMSRIRQTIAAKMHESWSTVPRVTNFDDADVTEMERLRQASKKDYDKSGIKLTALPFVIKAVAMALESHPLLNAAIDTQQQQIIFRDYVNVGIAVDTDRGLVVPALRAANKKSIADIARDLRSISEQARDNKFTLDDLRGGTFTISNLGAIGGTYSTPIVNVPEVAILLVGRSRKMPIVIGDQVQVRLMMPLSLSYDHRLVDGAAAARFLNEVIEYLAVPGRLLLAP